MHSKTIFFIFVNQTITLAVKSELPIRAMQRNLYMESIKKVLNDNLKYVKRMHNVILIVRAINPEIIALQLSNVEMEPRKEVETKNRNN